MLMEGSFILPARQSEFCFACTCASLTFLVYNAIWFVVLEICGMLQVRSGKDGEISAVFFGGIVQVYPKQHSKVVQLLLPYSKK